AGASGQETAAPEVLLPEEVPVTTVPGGDQATPVVVEPPSVQEIRKRGREGIDANAPPKSLRRDHAVLQPSGSSRGGKSLAAMQLCLASNIDPDPLAFADAPSPPPADVIRSSQGVAAVGDLGSENVSSPTVVGSLGSVYRPEWGVTNGSLLDTPEACQDLVAMGSQLRLRFEQEAKLLRKSVAQAARREQRIQARESEIKNLEVLLEAEAGMKRAAEEKSPGLIQELEKMRAQLSELQAAFEDYKRQQDQMVEQQSITGRRWVIGHGLRLTTMKCAESLEMRQAFTDVVSAGIAKGMKDDTGDDAPQFIRDLRPSSSQLSIPVYPEPYGHGVRGCWGCNPLMRRTMYLGTWCLIIRE
nr:hypothetical protein [Tanacetum cinerariifolium]